MKRSVVLALCSLCLVVVGFAAAAGENSSVRIENQSDWVIEEMYFAPVDDDDWGEDQLGEDVLEPGGSMTLAKIPCDEWDILIVDEDGDECILEEVDLCADKAVWTLTNDELLSCIVETDE